MMFSFLGFPAGGSVRWSFCAAVRRQAITRAVASGGCLGLARPDEFGDDAFERRSALHHRPTVRAELNPSLVEAVEHPDPRQRISRSLSAETLLPALARHRLDPDGALDEGSLATAERRIRKINPYATIHRTERCGIDLAEVLGRDAFNLERILEVEPGFLTKEHEHRTGSVSLVTDQ